MAANDPARRHRIARAAAATRHRLPDADARRAEVAVDSLAARIEAAVNGAPPLTAAQRDRLAALIRPGTAGGAGEQVAS